MRRSKKLNYWLVILTILVSIILCNGQALAIDNNGEVQSPVPTVSPIPTVTPVPNIVTGDLNGDKAVDSTDFTLLKRYLLHIIRQFTYEQGLIAADVNGDGNIDSIDLTLMKRYLLKIIDKFPEEGVSPTPTPTQAEEILGNKVEGTLNDGVAANFYNAIRYQASSDMTVNQMKVMIAKAGTGKMKCAIYSDSNGNPGTFLRGSQEKSNLGSGWQTFNLTSSLSLTEGNYYWMVSWRDGNYEVFSTSSTGCNWWGKLTYASSWPLSLPAKGGASDYRHSFYALYDPTVIVPTSDPTL
ncbi:MAG: dockerin type I domain-containing protein, partial [Bacillota bacterium]